SDPTGAWANDAQRHLEDDKKNAPSHSPYLNPSDYIRDSADPAVHREIEQYIEIALEQWLVLAIEDPTSDAGKAVQDIAETLSQQDHLDPMLMDLLSFAENRRRPVQEVQAVLTGTHGAVNGGWTASEQDRFSAMQALSAAFVYNKNDKPNDAVESSKKAANLFHNIGNVAGELLARYQEIYARQRQLDGETCLNLVNELWDRAFATQYHWLQGELALEKAMCANRVLKSGPTQDGLASSLALADKFHFPELKLRVIGADAGIKRLNHHYKEAWWKALEGLNQYWQDHDSSPERYYQFYAVMREIALDTDFPHTSETYLRRSIEIFKTAAPEDIELQAILYTSLANLLSQMGDDAGAEKEAQHARELIGSTGKNPVPVHFEMPAIELADFELRRHKPQQVLSTLAQIGDAPKTPDDFVRLDFYRIRGDAKLQLRQFDQADADYQKGIDVAQKFFDDFAKGKAKRLKDDATRIQDEAKRLNWALAIHKIYARMVQVRLEKNQSEKALAMWEWSKSLFLNGNANHLLNAEDAGAVPLPQTAYPYIVYASFEDRLQIWLVQNGRVLAKSVSVTKAELLGRIRAFNMKCGDKDSDESEAEKQGEDIYALLLRPIIADLAPPKAGALEDTVAVEWDDALPAFAIEALKDTSGHYFGEDYAVLHSPGILAEGFLHKPIPLKPQEQFLVADASPENGPEKLPGHELPTQAIKQAYSLTLLKNADLTPLKVRQALQSDAALLVISHGLLGDEGMGLKMTPDWSLQAKDFTQHVDRLRLAVLAACSSGYSENGLQDPDNMVRSLLASKVPNVIASRWDVDSQSTGELFEKFYTNLARGETPAQALRHARRDLRTAPVDPLHGRPDRTHPYYWAGFYLTGKAN
ncbi:MAG TPA: CHAT domain-containing protein, partial [Terriglobales bacterium]|nr:CHAT domain-containing protein [Terriglobales bacterium]